MAAQTAASATLLAELEHLRRIVALADALDQRIVRTCLSDVFGDFRTHAVRAKRSGTAGGPPALSEHETAYEHRRRRFLHSRCANSVASG